MTLWPSSSFDHLVIENKTDGKTLPSSLFTEKEMHNIERGDRQLSRQAVRYSCSLRRQADRHNVLLLSSSLHKNLIYTLCSPSASLLIFLHACVCVRAHCVVTDQYHYATERNDALSPLQSPHSTVPLLSLCLSSPLYAPPRPVSSSIYSLT